MVLLVCCLLTYNDNEYEMIAENAKSIIIQQLMDKAAMFARIHEGKIVV
ncbi:MAG: hypothetical protein QS748_01445 [Candidatus Endonucleobacter bathymodioli]|uniref:Uncharacterized protein n=1 Tax=Candidatus Endonucleibacter bathymodioli TaxID=539814 RepID=A0AA90SLL8_9GAMM|nr:hypothetical protein [Candidatus Endonucleobacter bathymodioli]